MSHPVPNPAQVAALLKKRGNSTPVVEAVVRTVQSSDYEVKITPPDMDSPLFHDDGPASCSLDWMPHVTMVVGDRQRSAFRQTPIIDPIDPMEQADFDDFVGLTRTDRGSC